MAKSQFLKKNNNNNKVDIFSSGSNNIKYTQKTRNLKSEKLFKSQKLFKSRKSKSKKLAKVKKLSKIRIFLNLILQKLN